MNDQGTRSRPDLPLWAGLWVPFAVVLTVLSRMHVIAAWLAVVIGVAAAVLISVTGRAYQRRKARQTS